MRDIFINQHFILDGFCVVLEFLVNLAIKTNLFRVNDIGIMALGVPHGRVVERRVNLKFITKYTPYSSCIVLYIAILVQFDEIVVIWPSYQVKQILYMFCQWQIKFHISSNCGQVYFDNTPILWRFIFRITISYDLYHCLVWKQWFELI